MSIFDTLGLRRKAPPNGEAPIDDAEQEFDATAEINPYEMVEATSLVDEVNREFIRRQEGAATTSCSGN